MEKNPREIALDILLDIEKNKIFSNTALNTGLRSNQFMSKQERAFITRLVEGVVETRIRLDYIINSFSNTKVNKCKPLIRCILRMGTYQIFYMEKVPDEAACNECVKLAEKRGFRNLKGFVNGVLRNISRNKDNIKYPDKANEHRKYISVMYSVPEEVIDILEEDYSPEDVESIVGAAFADRSTTIRVNRDRISVDEFKKGLESNGISVRRGNYTDNTLLIDDYDYIRHSKENIISVDDIRESLVQDIQIKPYNGLYKVYIIDEAEKLTVQAQNALLKTIEEPPEYSVIIFLTNNADIFLQTILSRCIVFNLKPLRDDVITDYLIKTYKIADYEAKVCSSFAQGILGKAIRLFESEDFNGVKEAAVRLVKNIYSYEIYDLIEEVKMISQNKVNINDFIDILEMWYRDVILFKVTKDPNNLIFKDEINYIRKSASKSSYEGLE